MKTKLIVFIFFVLFFVTTIHVQAETTIKPMIRVSPIILNIGLSPGKIYTYDITVENLLDMPLPLRLSVENFESTDDEGGFEMNVAKPPSPILSWIKLKNDDMILEAKEKRTFPLIITLPKTIPLGGYYAILFLQPVLPHAQSYSNLVQSKVGLVVLANIGVPTNDNEKGTISFFTSDKNFVEEGNINLNLAVKNTSLYHFSGKPFITIESFHTPSVRREIGEKVILPGKTRKWIIPVSLPTYNKILYKITAHVSTGQGNFIEKSTYIVAFPLTKMALLVTCIIIILIVIRKRSKLKRAMQELLR